MAKNTVSDLIFSLRSDFRYTRSFGVPRKPHVQFFRAEDVEERFIWACTGHF